MSATNQIDLLKLFEQIKWAENGDIIPFSKTNYATGWSYLGDDTPTVEDFNAIQQWNDKKDQWLYGQIKTVCQKNGITTTEADLTALFNAIKKMATQPNATTSKTGIVKLNSATNSDSETEAATPKVIKLLKGLIDSNARNLNNYIPNSKKSNAVNSTSGDTVATSAAVKTAYDKGVQALNAANAKQSPATTLAGYGIKDFIVKNISTENLNDLLTPGLYGQPANVNTSTARNYPENQAGALQVLLSAYGVQQEYTTYGTKNKYVRSRQDSSWTSWKRIDGANWSEIRGKPTTLSGYGITNAVAIDMLIGIPLPYPLAAVPSGFLAMNGQKFDKARYPKLAQKYPSGVLPDLRGEFIRGWDNGRNVDAGRGILSSQKGSVTAIDIAPTIEDSAVHGLVIRSQSFSRTPLDAAKVAGFDATTSSDMSNFYQVWARKAEIRGIEGADAANAHSNSNAGAGNGHINGYTRPRNIAFQYICLAG